MTEVCRHPDLTPLISPQLPDHAEAFALGSWPDLAADIGGISGLGEEQANAGLPNVQFSRDGVNRRAHWSACYGIIS